MLIQIVLSHCWKDSKNMNILSMARNPCRNSCGCIHMQPSTMHTIWMHWDRTLNGCTWCWYVDGVKLQPPSSCSIICDNQMNLVGKYIATPIHCDCKINILPSRCFDVVKIYHYVYNALMLHIVYHYNALWLQEVTMPMNWNWRFNLFVYISHFDYITIWMLKEIFDILHCFYKYKKYSINRLKGTIYPSLSQVGALFF